MLQFNKHRYFYIGLLLAGICLTVDQISKYYLLHLLENAPDIKINFFLKLTLAWNYGISFSLFNNFGVQGSYIIIILASFLCLLLFIWLYRTNNNLLCLSIGMIIGGAIGNITDRIRYNAVLDFILLHYKSFAWPIFNFADIFITVGTMMIFYNNYLRKKYNE